MINIELNDKLYNNIPTTWDEMTVGVYQQWLQKVKQITKETEDLDDNFQTFVFLSALIGCSIDELLGLNAEDFLQLVEAFGFVNTQPEDKGSKIIVIEDISYSVRQDFEQINTGEMIMIENIIKSNPDTVDVAMILSVLIRPIVTDDNGKFSKKNYEVEKLRSSKEIKDRSELFKKHLNVSQVHKYINDFFPTGLTYNKDTKGSTTLKIIK